MSCPQAWNRKAGLSKHHRGMRRPRAHLAASALGLSMQRIGQALQAFQAMDGLRVALVAVVD